MMTFLILACVTILIFTIYNISALSKFGVPSSLSATFYLWNDIQPN